MSNDEKVPQSIRPLLAKVDEARIEDKGPDAIPNKTIRTRVVVKVEISKDGRIAHIVSKPGSSMVINERHSSVHIQRRFERGDRIGYFIAQIRSSIGDIEIGERLFNQSW